MQAAQTRHVGKFHFEINNLMWSADPARLPVSLGNELGEARVRKTRARTLWHRVRGAGSALRAAISGWGRASGIG
jgi:hypothetical protein